MSNAAAFSNFKAILLIECVFCARIIADAVALDPLHSSHGDTEQKCKMADSSGYSWGKHV